MCGRFTRYHSWQEVHDYLSIWTEAPASNLQPRYNISPTQEVEVVLQNTEGHRVTQQKRWGLLPAWATDTKFSAKTFNARCETMAEKPSFRSAFKSRRCIVPASGYYEWHTEDGVKQPYHITLPDTPVVAFAGLYETNTKLGDKPTHSFTIITTEASEAVQEVHHRMPVILQPETFETWLDASSALEKVARLMRSYEGDVQLDRVGREVGNVKNQGQNLIAAKVQAQHEH